MLTIIIAVCGCGSDGSGSGGKNKCRVQPWRSENTKLMIMTVL